MLACGVLVAATVLAGWMFLGRDVAAPGPLVPAVTPSAGTATPSEPSAAPASLAVATQPAGAVVIVDGRRLGPSPVTWKGIPAGAHVIVIQRGSQAIRHAVRVAAGESLSVVVPMTETAAAAAPVAGAGFIRVQAPVELRVTRDGRLLGTSEMARIPLDAGTHTLHLSNDLVGYRATQAVRVTPGKTTTVEVEIPGERVAINAIPWAEVLVDGRAVGETPLGALTLPPGPHVVVLRHPRLGERTVDALVKVGEPTRISVDMRR
jgi:hypothetical protein